MTHQFLSEEEIQAAEQRCNWQKQLITGEHGDCLRAAFANCLGLPIDSVPHFESDGWFDNWVRWFRERGIGLVWYGFRPGISHSFPGLYVLSVKSPRMEGRTHCVVAQEGTIVFDPHPDSDNTPADPETANGAYLFHILSPCDLRELRRVVRELAEAAIQRIACTAIKESGECVQCTKRWDAALALAQQVEGGK